MKRNLNKVFLSLILVSFILFPKLVLAKTISSDIISINESLNLDVDNVRLTNLVFKDWSKTTTMNFGLSGYITNKNNYDVSLKVTVYYYNNNKEELVFFVANKELLKNEDYTFNLMSNSNAISISVDDIKYYSIKVEENKINKEEFTKPSDNNEYNYYSYVIDKYDVNIVINEDNTYDITENIDAYFQTPSHGINRTIPLKKEIKSIDENKGTLYTRISNIKVNNFYEKIIANGFINLKIGSADKTISQLNNYVISYKHILGNDVNKEYDEVYYNIIGNDWNTVIGNITFKITLPKSFDSSKLGFSSGVYGSTDSDNVEYNVNGNVITGSYHGILKDHNALTMRLVLDDGYFKSSSIITNNVYLLIIIPVLFVIFGFYLWKKYGRDDEVIETVEFYPPYDKNSLDVAYLYKGNVTYKDVISLLFYLASKNYLKIEEISTKRLLLGKKKNYKIIKLKDYDGNNDNERIFFNGLFTCNSGSVIKNDDKEEAIFIDDLKEVFYKIINEIVLKENGTTNHNLIYEKSGRKKIIMGIFYIISIIFMMIPFNMVGALSNYAIVIAISSLFNIIAYILLPFNTNKKSKYYGSVALFTISSIISFSVIFTVFRYENVFMILSLIWILSIILILIEAKYITKRSKYGIEALGKIRGFRNFLETAEKSKLEALVEENPSYFYDILPYTYSLGVSDKWVKNFEGINMQPPTWYIGNRPFNIVYFNNSINECMAASTSFMTSMPNTSSSSHGFGGSSGGGFSGGGFGGGGGSSW